MRILAVGDHLENPAVRRSAEALGVSISFLSSRKAASASSTWTAA